MSRTKTELLKAEQNNQKLNIMHADIILNSKP